MLDEIHLDMFDLSVFRWLYQVCLSKGHFTEEYAASQVSLSLFPLVRNVVAKLLVCNEIV